jgi:hypothetical protein
MKYFFLTFLTASCLSLVGSDTLTRAQIYNFNVGDTFDYREVNTMSQVECNDYEIYSLTYKRCIINNINYSQNNDTLFIVRQWIYPQPVYYDSLILDSLQYPEVYIDSQSCHTPQFSFDSTSLFNNLASNSVAFNCVGQQAWVYVAGLGNVCSTSSFADGGNSTWDSITLIYYSRAGITWGTPYYVANNSNLIHYTPIPEECASWIYNSSCQFSPIRITTGNGIAFEGHTYVEMLYSANNYDENPTVDSLLGYFRNDTLNRRVYLYNALDNTPYLTYDFSVPAGGNVWNLSQVRVGGQLRTYWNEDCSAPIPTGYIEGVGGAAGMGVAYPCAHEETNQFFTFPVYDCGQLTCFSVCGQTLYPDSGADCSFPLAVNEINPYEIVNIQPNPADKYLYVEMGAQRDYEFGLFNAIGQEVDKKRTRQVDIFDTEKLSNGVYLIEVIDKNSLNKIVTRKVVVEH